MSPERFSASYYKLLLRYNEKACGCIEASSSRGADAGWWGVKPLHCRAAPAVTPRLAAYRRLSAVKRQTHSQGSQTRTMRIQVGKENLLLHINSDGSVDLNYILSAHHFSSGCNTGRCTIKHKVQARCIEFGYSTCTCTSQEEGRQYGVSSTLAWNSCTYIGAVSCANSYDAQSLKAGDENGVSRELKVLRLFCESF